MGENDFTNDTTENIVSEPITEVDEGNVPEADGYDENITKEDYYEPSAAEENVADTLPEQPEADAVSESSEADDVSVAEQKGHKSDLDGYRAYRRKNLRDKDTAPVNEKSAKRKFQEVKIQGNLLYMAGLVVITLLDFFIVHLFTL